MSIENAIDEISDRIKIPVVWNTGGYERIDTVKRLSGFCSVFLQDLKFYSSDLSLKYASTRDYFKHAIAATERMIEETGAPKYDSEGILLSGVIVRHLILPSNRQDSIMLLRELYNTCGSENIILSLMSQYTPPAKRTRYQELNRRLTDFEYKSVCETALELGFSGYFQQRDSAVSSYTPIFDLDGI